MPTYRFERIKGTLNTGRVKEIIKESGYEPGNYTYTEESSKDVRARGTVEMSVNTLEHTARSKLGYKTTTVSVIDTGRFGGVAMVAPSMGNMLGATEYGVTVSMPQATVEALSSGDFSLYGFKSVQTNAGGGAPLVWFKSRDFGLSTDVSWQIQYEAYTSRSQIIPNGQIKGLSSYDADLGQTLEVETPQGTGNVVDGTPGVISIENLTDTPLTCGISEVVNGSAEPLCAFPLYGNGLDAMVPIQKVMFTFSTNEVNTGTVIEKAYSQSVLIDLTSKTSREVSFDINKGWSWGGYSWAQAIRPSTNIVPLLIEKNADL